MNDTKRKNYLDFGRVGALCLGLFSLFMLQFYFGYVCGLLSCFRFTGSVVVSSIGFDGGFVAFVQPIQAPMNKIATSVIKTGTAISQSWSSAAEPLLSHNSITNQNDHELNVIPQQERIQPT